MRRPTITGLQDSLTWLAAGIALFVEAQGSWKFFTARDGLDYHSAVVLWPSFAVWTVAMVATAMRAWRSRIDSGSAGLDGVILGAMAAASGFFAASAETHIAGEAFRIAVAVIAAVLLERATARGRKEKLAIEGNQQTSILGRLRQRVEARFGLAELDVSAAQLARKHGRIAWAAYRGKLGRRALRRSMGLDAAGRRDVRVLVAALHQATEALTSEAVKEISPWNSPAEFPTSENTEVARIRPWESFAEFTTPAALPAGPTGRLHAVTGSREKRLYRDPEEVRREYERITQTSPEMTFKEIALKLGYQDPSGLRYALKKTEPKAEA